MKNDTLSEQNGNAPWFAIGTVERDTGIGRDTLRVWEKRYGFPSPGRNRKGERVFSAGEIRRLQLIRRLLDQGMRPGKVVPLSEHALHDLALALPEATTSAEDAHSEEAQLIALASSCDVPGLLAALEQSLSRTGLRGFVLETFAPLVRAVGDRWAGGRLEIFEEHLITRQLVRFLDVAMSRLGPSLDDPHVLLGSLPGEHHALGLLMVEALLRHSGVATLNLGPNIPMDQIVAAVERTRVSAVALSFSASYPRGSIRTDLQELASRLSPGVEVWIGGEGVRRLPRLPPSVVRKSLNDL